MAGGYAPRRRSTTITAAILIALGAVAVLAIGLSPTPAQTPVSDALFRFLLWAQQTPGLGWITFDLVEALSNVALFIPIGALVYLLLPRRLWWLSLAIGPALSIMIEVGQSLLLPERTASIWDVLLNSSGAFLGVGLAAWISLRAAAAAYDRSDEPLSRIRPSTG